MLEHLVPADCRTRLEMREESRAYICGAAAASEMTTGLRPARSVPRSLGSQLPSQVLRIAGHRREHASRGAGAWFLPEDLKRQAGERIRLQSQPHVTSVGK